MSKSTFLQSVRTEIRAKYFSYRTDESYLYWVRILLNVTGHSGDHDRFAHGHHAGVGFTMSDHDGPTYCRVLVFRFS